MAEESKGNDGNTPSHEESKGNETSCCRKTWEGLITKFIWRKRKEVMISVLSHNHVGGKPLESHGHQRFIGKPNIGEHITVSLSIDEFAFYDSTVIISWETYGLSSNRVSISLFKDNERMELIKDNVDKNAGNVEKNAGGEQGIEWKVKDKHAHAEGTDYWIKVEETEADSDGRKVYGNSPSFTITDSPMKRDPSEEKTDSEQETKESEDLDGTEPATDKYEKENIDTVTSVAACDDYIAWGSKAKEKWVRIAHGAFDDEKLVLDFPLETIQEMAVKATRVRIQDAGNPMHMSSVTSKPGTYPIDDVRNGKTIGFSRGIKTKLSKKDVPKYWESEGDKLECMWYDGMGGDHEPYSLETRVYNAGNNYGGLHWCNQRKLCKWDFNASGADSQDQGDSLELLIDPQGQEQEQYGVFISHFDTKGYKTFFYPTKGIVQDLEFVHSSKATKKLVCADLEGYISIYEERKTDGQTGLGFHTLLCEKPNMNLMESHLTAVSSQWDDEKDEGWVVVGTDENTVHVFSVNAKDRKLSAAQAKDEIGAKDKDVVISMQGKVLDVEFLGKQASIQLVTADDSGHLSIFEFVSIAKPEQPELFEVYIHFFQKFNFFAVEPGCMLSSSDDGSKIVVACGKKMGFAPMEENPYTEPTERTTSAELILEQSKAIVLERVNKSENVKELQSYIKGIEKLEKKTKTGSEKDFLRAVSKSFDPKRVSIQHDAWEEVASFYHDSLVSGVDMSGDGKRIAVATEKKEALVYDVDFGCTIRSLRCEGRIKSICLDDNGKHLLVGGFDKKLQHFNIEEGFHKSFIKTFTEAKKVQSVSIDSQGKVLAIGTNSSVMVFKMNADFVKDADPQAFREIQKKVLVVKLSPDGRLLAVGDSSEVNVYDLHITEENGSEKEHTGLLPPVFTQSYDAAIEGLDFKNNSNNKEEYYVLAVGSWNGSAYVYHFKAKEKTDHQGFFEDLEAHGKSPQFKREDRVFDVSLTDDGLQLAVGGRDKNVALYQLPEFGKERNYEHGDDPDKEFKSKYFQKDDVDRVYCCAISPKGTYVVYGGISKKLLLYNVEDQHLLQTYYHKASINRVQFMKEDAFCAVSGDGLFLIYQVHNSTPTLQINLDGPANSIALSKEAKISVIGHGKKVTVFRNEGYGPLDCPSMALARKLLDDPKSLDVALKSHPTLVNMSDSSKKTLLHHAVENDNMDALDVLLASKAKIGLLLDVNGDTALMIAVAKSQKMMIDKLLSAIISKDIANTPDAFDSLFLMMKLKEKKDDVQRCVFKRIGEEFPNVLVRFLGTLKMERCEDHVQQGLVLARMAAPILFGHDRRSPMNFWKYYHDVHQDDEDGFLDDFPQYQVFAYRMPIKGLCGLNIKYEDNKGSGGDKDSGGDKGSDDKVKGQSSKYKKLGDGDKSIGGDRFFSPLEVIVDASRTLKDCSVFDKGTIVHDMVMFKWQILGPIFKFSAYFYTIYLALCVIFVLSLTKVHCSECEPGYFSMNTHLLACRIVAPILIVLSFYYLCRELKQFIGEYNVVLNVESKFRKFWIALKNHFFADIWNILDIMAFVTQLVTDILYYSTHSNTALGFAAVSIMLGFWKILFYARGWYEHWGPFVKMIQASFRSLVSFVAVLVVFLLGYAFAFTIVLNASPDFDSPSQSLKEVTLMVYGEFSDDLLDAMDGWKLVTVLFEVMLLTCVVMMLNLLVAILSDSYTAVKEHSNQETIYEIAKIIVEIERVDLIRFNNEILFPKWIHALKPMKMRRLKVKTEQNKTFAMIAELQQEIKNLQEGQEDQTRILQQVSEKLSGSSSSTEEPDNNSDDTCKISVV